MINLKIGVLGGTFNPIHKGHLHLANQCLDKANLDKIIVVPTNKPSHKNAPDLADFAHRLNMCRLAFHDNEKIEVSDTEKMSEYSYTFFTLLRLKAKYPQDELHFILGSDMLLTLDEWKHATEIYKLTKIICLSRNYHDMPLLIKKKDELSKQGAVIEIIDGEVYPLSSTKVKNELELITDDIPPKVYEYIRQNSLYNIEDYDFSQKIEEIQRTASSMLRQKRFSHTLAVVKAARELAEYYGENTEKAALAAMAHDICKEMAKEEMLQWIKKSDIIFDDDLLSLDEVLHGFAAAEFIRERFLIYNTDVINAVRYHTTARANMSNNEKIVYIADLISEDREYSDVEKMRKIAYVSLDKGMRYALRYTISDLVKSKILITAPTIDAYNYYCI